MEKGFQETLLELLTDPGTAAAQADIAQAAALARQEVSFRQRTGAAAAHLRRARESGADPEEISALEAVVKKRTARLEAAGVQARAANFKRPQPDDTAAQVFGRAEGTVEEPPLTVAALSQEGDVIAHTCALDNGAFHLSHEGDLDEATLQISDGSGRVLFRATEPVTIPAGRVLYLDVSLEPPKPEPGPVPVQPKMPDLIGQSEGVALALLRRIGRTDVKVVDKVSEGQPDLVIAQSPKAGTDLTEKTKIKLTVRRAKDDPPAIGYLPGFVGCTLEAAAAALTELGLEHAVKLQVDDGPPGLVLAQTPPEGTRLDKVEVVTLTVSQDCDTAPKTVTVPELVGKPRDLALELVKAADLAAEIDDIGDPGKPAGVIAQDPKAGTTVARGSAVTLTVNTPPVPEPGKVVVPAVRGCAVSGAVSLLEDVQLEAKVAVRHDAAPKDEVIWQEPEAGARVEVGHSVALTVSKGPRRGGEVDKGLRKLIREMARDPRAEEAGLEAKRITATLRGGVVGDLDAAWAVAASPAAEVRGRLKLGSLHAARRFRAILRKALKKLD